MTENGIHFSFQISGKVQTGNEEVNYRQTQTRYLDSRYDTISATLVV